MITNKVMSKTMSLKTCQFPGCNNRLIGSQLKKLCDDKECIKARQKIYLKNKKNKYKNIVSNNRIISQRSIKNKLFNGQILRVRCKAFDSNGERCNNCYTIIYDPRVKMYPKFCDEHRNCYKRKRFSKTGVINAKSSN